MMRGLIWTFLLLAPIAQAADWTRLMRIPGEDQYFYDRSKLVIQGNDITYWKKVIFSKPQLVKNQAAAWVLMREQINCVQHSLRLISYLYYAADGSTIEYVPDHEKEGTPIIPDTLGDAFERNLCELVWAKQAKEKAEAERKAKAEMEAAEAAKQEAGSAQPPMAAEKGPDMQAPNSQVPTTQMPTTQVPGAVPDKPENREPAVFPNKLKSRNP